MFSADSNTDRIGTSHLRQLDVGGKPERRRLNLAVPLTIAVLLWIVVGQRSTCAGDEPIRSLRASIRTTEGVLPADVAAKAFRSRGAIDVNGDRGPGWYENCFSEHATAFCHRPLYFEETFLERYGHTHGCSIDCQQWPWCGSRHCRTWRDHAQRVVQPIVSAAHFYGTVPLIPYKLIAEPWDECVNTQGLYPAGHDAPPR